MFRLKSGTSRRPSDFNRFSATNNSEPQDILQVWFAGVHSDIGGGYPERKVACRNIRCCG